MPSREVAFVLVPGSFCPPTVYDKVTSILQSKGHTVSPTRLESAVKRGTRPPATFQDDVDHIHNTIVNLLNQDKDVVLAVNSYGGYPGTEAVKGLGRAERGEDKGGALIGLVYLAAFVPPIGSSMFSLFGQLPGIPGEEDDGYRDLPMEADGVRFADLVFNDLPADQRQGEFDKFVNQSAQAVQGQVTYAGYKAIPSTYVLCEQDKIIPPDTQRGMIEAANTDGADFRTVTMQAGHCPMVSQPETVARILLEAAGL